MKRLFVCFALLLGLAMPCAFADEKKAEAVVNKTGIPDVLIIPSAELSIDDLQKIVQTAVINRGWIPKITNKKTVNCTLDVRGKHKVVVDILLDPKKITIRYVSSENMKYDPVKKTIHRNYNNWVKNIQTDITKQIALKGMENK